VGGATLGDDIFVHFLEHEILALVGRRKAYGVEAERAFRTILLLAIRTVVPATAYWEDEWAAPLLEAFAPFRHTGRLQLLGTAPNPEAYLASKREHYAREPGRYTGYFTEPTRAEYDRLTELWRTRLRSTTSDIAEHWRVELTRGDVLFERLLHNSGAARGLDDHLHDVPEILGGDAFIGDFVYRALQQQRQVLLHPTQRSIVGQIVMRGYVRSFLTEIGGTAVLSGPTRAVDHLLAGAPFSIDLHRVEGVLDALGLGVLVSEFDATELLGVSETLEWAPVRDDILARAARTGPIWSTDEALALQRLEPIYAREPVERFRALCSRYSLAMQATAKRRLAEEAELEGTRKGRHIEIHGDRNVVGDVTGGHIGDAYIAHVAGDVRVTGNRLQLGGKSIDLADAPAEAVRRAVVEIVATAAPQDVVAHLEGVSRAVDRRHDVTDAEVTSEVAEAFRGPRDITLTERLKAVAGDITQQAAIGAASGGLTSAVLVGLQALGLA
jgi:hypothetical protein